MAKIYYQVKPDLVSHPRHDKLREQSKKREGALDEHQEWSLKRAAEAFVQWPASCLWPHQTRTEGQPKYVIQRKRRAVQVQRNQE